MFILFCSQCALKDKDIKDKHKCTAHIQLLKLYFYWTFSTQACVHLAHMPVLALIQNVLLFTLCDAGQKAFFFYYFVLDYRPKPSATIVRWAVISYKTAITCFFLRDRNKKKKRKSSQRALRKQNTDQKKTYFCKA